MAPAQASPKVSSSACRTLSRLLCVTLSTATQQEADDNVWKRLQQMAISEKSPPSEKSEFLKEIYARLPAPLILLLNLLPTATSHKLRQAAALGLCHSILVETRAVWDDQQDTTSKVLRSAIECCIALSRDKDGKRILIALALHAMGRVSYTLFFMHHADRVVSAAKKTMADYRHNSGRHHIDSAIAPRILELFEELPALAQSGRETELRGKINLISGYLMVGGSSLRSSLTSVAKESQTSLAVLFDVDFDSIRYAPRVETIDSWNVWQPDTCRFRFMMDDTAKSSRDMVQLLGAALGQKGASSFVDACVADVLEACMATTHTLIGAKQVDWLHQWIGFIIVAEEVRALNSVVNKTKLNLGSFGALAFPSNLQVLVGAFREVGDGHAVNQIDEKTDSNRHSRRRLKRLHFLAGAILPVITSPPLWTLPNTVLDNADYKTEKSELIRNMTITEVRDDLDIQTVSASALKGNAALVCSLIGLLSETFALLSKDVECFLPIILFPLCEKASSHNHSQVQRTAALALDQVAKACGLSSTRDLIHQNFDYLFGAMLSQSRRPRGQGTGPDSSLPTSIPSIVQMVLRSAADVDATTNDVRCERSLCDERHISYVIELVYSLVASFDNSLVILNSDSFRFASAALDLVQVFDAALAFIASTFGLSLNKENSPFADVQIPDASEDWMAVLEPFRKRCKPLSNDLRPKEGFEKIQNDEEGALTATDNLTGPSDDQPSIEITDGELDFVSLGLERCSFFLSSPSLQVEMASIIGMQRAFALLGYVAMYGKVRAMVCNHME